MDANDNSYKLLCEACTNHNCTRLLSRFVVIAACSGFFYAQIYNVPGDKLIPCHDRLPMRPAGLCIFLAALAGVAFRVPATGLARMPTSVTCMRCSARTLIPTKVRGMWRKDGGHDRFMRPPPKWEMGSNRGVPPLFPVTQKSTIYLIPGDRVAGVPYIGQPPTVCFSNVVSDAWQELRSTGALC